MRHAMSVCIVRRYTSGSGMKKSKSLLRLTVRISGSVSTDDSATYSVPEFD